MPAHLCAFAPLVFTDTVKLHLPRECYYIENPHTLAVPAEDSTGMASHKYPPSEQTWLPNKQICALSLQRLIPVFPVCLSAVSFIRPPGP